MKNLFLEEQQQKLKNRNSQLQVANLKMETEKEELEHKLDDSQRDFNMVSNEKSINEEQLKNINLEEDK